MRPIEFRAWFKETKEMICANRYPIITHSKGSSSMAIMRGDADIKATAHMQFTGLLDKNGTKIFEGDVVRVHDCEVFIGQVLYRQAYCSFEVATYTANSTMKPYELSLTAKDHYEVIGNIHENPELLREEK